MSRLGSTLFVNSPGARVSSERGALIVAVPEEGKTRVPIEPLEQVALIGRVSMSTEAIARCVAAGVRVAALTRTGRIRFVCAAATSGNVHLRIAQLRKSDNASKALEFSKVVVAGKIQNSLRLLRRWRDDAEGHERHILDSSIDAVASGLVGVAAAPTADHLRGIEGDSARRYFKCLGAHLSYLEAPMNLLGRSRRPPTDPVNAALSFGYGLLTADLIAAADVVGLDPQVGLFHVARSGRPALALDLLEEQRSQVVDRFVVGALRRRQLRLEHFEETPGGGWFLTDEGRRNYFSLFDAFRRREVPHALLGRPVALGALPVLQTTVLARYLRGELASYVPWQGG